MHLVTGTQSLSPAERPKTTMDSGLVVRKILGAAEEHSGIRNE
jgi:hypothetical protein